MIRRDSEPVRLIPTAEQQERARRDGRARTDAAIARRFKHWNVRAEDREQRIRNDTIGCFCELMAGHYLGLPYNPSIGEIDNVDLDKKVEVRGIANPRYCELPIRPPDKPERLLKPHLLVRTTEAIQWASLEGWLLGWEAMDRIELLELKLVGEGHGARWYVPGPFHSIRSLQDWLLCGAPPHIARPRSRLALEAKAVAPKRRQKRR
jgi:hypothetical protein